MRTPDHVDSGWPWKRRARLLLSRSDAHSGLVLAPVEVIARASSVSRVDYRRRRVSSLPRVPRLEVAVVRSMGGRPPLMVEVFLVLQRAAPHVMVLAVGAVMVRTTAAEVNLSSVSSRVDGHRRHLVSVSPLSLRGVAQRLVQRLVARLVRS